MHILFVAPHFPAGQRQFVRALAAVGARVTGIGEAPAHALGDELRGMLHGYEQVSSVCDEDALQAAVRRVQAREWVDRLEATIETHILPTARVRERCTIPGLSVAAAILCRDKPEQKAFMARHRIPCAASTAVETRGEALAFAQKVGFPLIVKPRAGAGAAGTARADDAGELSAALASLGVGDQPGRASVALEEFVTGHEGFYDTLTVAGEVVHEFISHYYPNVLEAMRTRWISPQIVTTNRTDAPGYEELKALGRRVIDTLGLGTATTHMEWFFGPKGLRFSELGVRPPGVSHWDLYCAANDIDLYREWASALVHGHTERALSRRFAAGIINLRPDRDGRITGYEGVDDIHRRFGEYVIDAHLPPPGTPTQPVEAGYMANAWIRMRHPDYDALREILDTIGETVQVRAG